MTYEVQLQIGEVSHVVRGPDVDGVLRLVEGLKGHESMKHLTSGGNAFSVLHSGNGVAPKADTTETKTKVTAAPWYPDSSGKWIEVSDSCVECPVDREAEIEVLLNYERMETDFCSEVRRAGDLEWNESPFGRYRIVAYRIEK